MNHDFQVYVNFDVFADFEEQAHERVQPYIDQMRLKGVRISRVERTQINTRIGDSDAKN